MLKMLQLARNLPWPIHVLLAWMTNGGITAVDAKPKTKSKTNGRA
jgi:hypothetical protein